MTCESRNINRININPIKSVYYGFNELLLNLSAYSGGYPFSISGDIRSVPS